MPVLASQIRVRKYMPVRATQKSVPKIRASPCQPCGPFGRPWDSFRELLKLWGPPVALRPVAGLPRGGPAPWQDCPVAVQPHGRTALWQSSPVAVQPQGSLALRQSSPRAVWPCGSPALGQSGPRPERGRRGLLEAGGRPPEAEKSIFRKCRGSAPQCPLGLGEPWGVLGACSRPSAGPQGGPGGSALGDPLIPIVPGWI